MNNEFYFFWYIKNEKEILFKMVTSKKFDDIVQKPRIFITEIMFYLKMLITQFGTDI